MSTGDTNIHTYEVNSFFFCNFGCLENRIVEIGSLALKAEKYLWILMAFVLFDILSQYQARHTMADTLMMPSCMPSLSVACATLTQPNATAVRRNFAKQSEKVGEHEVICGSPINCGRGTTGTKLQRRPASTPAHRWGWIIWVWVVIDNNMSHRNCSLLC